MLTGVSFDLCIRVLGWPINPADDITNSWLIIHLDIISIRILAILNHGVLLLMTLQILRDYKFLHYLSGQQTGTRCTLYCWYYSRQCDQSTLVQRKLPHERLVLRIKTFWEFCKWMPSVLGLSPGEDMLILNTETPRQLSNLRWQRGLFWIVMPLTIALELP